jgi:hypothetical protein
MLKRVQHDISPFLRIVSEQLEVEISTQRISPCLHAPGVQESGLKKDYRDKLRPGYGLPKINQKTTEILNPKPENRILFPKRIRPRALANASKEQKKLLSPAYSFLLRDIGHFFMPSQHKTGSFTERNTQMQ